MITMNEYILFKPNGSSHTDGLVYTKNVGFKKKSLTKYQLLIPANTKIMCVFFFFKDQIFDCKNTKSVSSLKDYNI